MSAMMRAPDSPTTYDNAKNMHLPSAIWRLLFAKFRWIWWMAAAASIFPVLRLAMLEIPEKSDLTEVHGIYKMPFIRPNSKGYATTVEASDGNLKKCNCAAGSGGPSCLSQNHADNLDLMRSLRDQPVTVLMSTAKMYEQIPLCFEIRTDQTTLVSYEQSKARYLKDKNRVGDYLFHILMFLFLMTVYGSTFVGNKER
ncbi:hypothetical protein [Acidovorax sp. Root217]|uniref:hypothetical protein n=1 Tax=Acidovorax sp. Root217 TaxID=1736492 RepID=UPI00070BDBC3|nr:hypothetical protein [Acidovorax sp. Root217]KRC14659.1 hypothetical protein ASE31_07810 [Acidovorax sp. Root217]